jgi:glycosyltransferase involved in cell wall biosynthesis
MTADPHPVPARIDRAAALRELRTGIGARAPRQVARAVRTALFPGRWPPPVSVRMAVLDEAVARGDREAVRARVADDRPLRPGTIRALGRAAALEALAVELPARDADVERRVAAYLRGTLGSAVQAPRPDPARAEASAREAAAGLRAAGHAQPWIIATLPGFVGNPYTDLIELAYARHGLAAVHVERPDEIDAIVSARRAAAFEVIVHVNASNRVVASAMDAAAARTAAVAALARIDRWIAAGVPLVVSVHDGPILHGERAEAERFLAQGIADRASVIHLLTAATPSILGDWLVLDESKTVHVPHPNYDGAYPPLPSRETARASVGVDPRDPAEDGPELLLGMIGTLRGRKGVLTLLDALEGVPDPLPDGRRLRLLLAGTPGGPDAETLIRRAAADPRVIDILEFVPDAQLPTLLAAVDVAVVPYERYLNSGWLVLALGSGIPVIAPVDATAEEIARPDALRTFSHAVDGSLAAALAGAGELATVAARRAARASVARLVPEEISERFVRSVLLPARPAG